MGAKILKALNSKPAYAVYGVIATVAGQKVKSMFTNRKKKETSSEDAPDSKAS